MKLKKILVYTSLVVVVVASIYGYSIYKKIFSANTSFSEEQVYVHIPTDSDFFNVQKILTPYVNNIEDLTMVAEKKSYVVNVKPGRFLLKKGMNSNDIINSLRNNIPVKVSFNNQERLEDFVGRISQQIEVDSLSLLNACLDEKFLADNDLNKDNVLGIFIPNSYEFLWNTNAKKFLEKMLKENRKFWNDERLKKAADLNLSPMQVISLASIVHKETVKSDERPRVAGVYLNRLKKGMKLEADPTVIYAVKKEANDFDMVIKRVLYKDLEVNSPYNTYKFEGIPPGPIAMPDISAIDAVLNYEKHQYIYFCASVTNFGYHEFAVNLAQHEANRQKYVAWISKQGVKR